MTAQGGKDERGNEHVPAQGVHEASIGRATALGGAIRECAVLLAALLASVVNTWPLAKNFFALTGPDNWSQMLWNFWWVKEALLHRHCNSFFTPMLFYPDGAGLAFHTLSFTNCVIFLPVSFLASGIYGVLLAYRVQILAALALTCYCTYRLVLGMTGRAAAGLLAGLFLAFRSFHIAHLHYPHLNSMFWLPMYAWSLVRLADGEKGRWQTTVRGAVSGVLFALAVYSSTEYALFLAFLAALQVGWQYVARRDARRRLILRVGASYLVALLLLIPLLVAMYAERRRGDLYEPPLNQDVLLSADLASFILPSGRHFLLGEFTEALEAKVNHGVRGNDVFLGYVGLLVLAGSLAALGRRCWSVWLLSAIVFFLLSLGPYLHVGGATFEEVWLPYLLLKKLPLMDMYRTPIRFQTMFLFSACVVMGLGAAAWMERRVGPQARNPRIWTAFGLVALVLAVECKYDLTKDATRVPACVPRVYEFIAKQPGDFAIAELPTGYLADRQYMAFQAVHGKALFNGSLSRKPRVTATLSNAYDRGFRYILIHKQFHSDEESFRKLCILTSQTADFMWTEDGIALFRVRPSPVSSAVQRP